MFVRKSGRPLGSVLVSKAGAEPKRPEPQKRAPAKKAAKKATAAKKAAPAKSAAPAAKPEETEPRHEEASSGNNPAYP